MQPFIVVLPAILSLMPFWIVLTAALLTTTAHAQWQIQDSHTTASFRGIHNVGNGVVWASGTEGTVLRTTDEGTTWQRCTTPPEAEKLDFRGIQAFDQNTAIVMSSGQGNLSRLYKTTDACKTWKLLFTNPDKEGFWDAIKFPNPKLGFILGDPITRAFNYAKPRRRKFTGFALLYTEDGGDHFLYRTSFGNEADISTQGAFAASNSSLFIGWPGVWFGTGGKAGAKIYLNVFQQHIGFPDDRIELGSGEWRSINWPVPLAKGDAAGIFSVSFKRSELVSRDSLNVGTGPVFETYGIAVGGDYKKPEEHSETAAFTIDGGQHWTASQTPPHGYRSSVAYDSTTETWITVGPNGTDISRDDGKNWSTLKPSAQDAPDTDKNWNALSLPFVVGPKGRIGKLRPEALAH
ncbi:hypothetical protein [Edaphobacter modestus]|uniref:Photosystem II stability/assembly factor-like uncharacterized protein n=1 Tax=Edaphobacter modestus TaxID=388466 RepID=A0A4Q7YQF8_9BACT|nr:hypothetical protein [Edaphobacter modestus]RZU39992.1 photosystem II stability/assembly factor-like uncharacterized protein [Edaphobacter modestus]